MICNECLTDETQRPSVGTQTEEASSTREAERASAKQPEASAADALPSAKTDAAKAPEPLLHYPDVARTSLPPGASPAAASSNASQSNAAQKSAQSSNGAVLLNGRGPRGKAGPEDGSRGAATGQGITKGSAGDKGKGDSPEAAQWEKPSQLQEWDDDSGSAKPGLAGGSPIDSHSLIMSSEELPTVHMLMHMRIRLIVCCVLCYHQAGHLDCWVDFNCKSMWLQGMQCWQAFWWQASC
jgi:hypothetical protein